MRLAITGHSLGPNNIKLFSVVNIMLMARAF